MVCPNFLILQCDSHKAKRTSVQDLRLHMWPLSGRYPDSLYLTLGRVHYLDVFPRRQHFLKHRVFSRGKFSRPPPALRHARIHTVTTLSLTLTWMKTSQGCPTGGPENPGGCSVFSVQVSCLHRLLWNSPSENTSRLSALYSPPFIFLTNPLSCLCLPRAWSGVPVSVKGSVPCWP